MKRLQTFFLVAIASILMVTSYVYAEPIIIEYWGTWGGISGKNVETPLITQFNEEYEGVYKVIGNELEVREKLPVAVAGGVPPTVVKIDRYQLGAYALMGLLQPLDGLIERDGLAFDEFYPAATAESMFDGKVYAIPWTIDDRALYYNVDLFHACGLDPRKPPKTWEDLEEYSKKLDFYDGSELKRVGFSPTRGNWSFLGWLWAAGGEVLDESGQTALINSPAGRKAVNWLADFISRYGGDGVIGAAWDAGGGFIGGSAGMVIDGCFFAGPVLDENPGLEWRVAPPPRPAGLEDTPITWSGGHAFAIPTGISDEELEAAWEFIKFYTSHEAQVTLGIGSQGWLPALRSAATSYEFLSAVPEMETFVYLMDYTTFRPVTPFGDAFYGAIFGVDGAIAQGDKSPDEVLAQAAQNAQKALDDGWKDPFGMKAAEKASEIAQSSFSVKVGAENAIRHGDGAPSMDDNVITHGWNNGFYEYEFTIPQGQAGNYTLYVFAATWSDAGRIFTIDNEQEFLYVFPGYNDWNRYDLFTVKSGIPLTAGKHTIKIAVERDYLNLDYFQLVKE